MISGIFDRALSRALLCCFGALAFASCSSLSRNPFEQRGSEIVWLQVENYSFVDYTVSVERGGARARLGIVTPQQSRRFRVPDDLVGRGVSVRFLADPVGSNRVYASPDVVVAPGDAWRWTLAATLSQSTLVRVASDS